MNILIKLAIRSCISGAAYIAGTLIMKEAYNKTRNSKYFNTSKKAE